MRATLGIVGWALLVGALECSFPPAMLFRPAVGASMAALLIYGGRAWSALFLGILGAGRFLDRSWQQSLIQARHSLQGLWALALVRRQVGFSIPLYETRDLVHEDPPLV